jgi:hypothetical protein
MLAAILAHPQMRGRLDLLRGLGDIAELGGDQRRVG